MSDYFLDKDSNVHHPAGPFDCHYEERSDVVISLARSVCPGTNAYIATGLPRCARNDNWKTERPCIIPGGVEHYAQGQGTRAVALDIFSPVREEFKY